MATYDWFEKEMMVRRIQSKVEEVYEEARQDMEKKVAEFNRKFTVKQRAHLKDVKEGRWTQERYDDWLRGQVFQGKEWAAKRDQIISTLENREKIAIDMINKDRRTVFAVGANYQAYELEHGAGVSFGFRLYDSATVQRLIEENPMMLPEWKIDEPKDYIWNYRNVNNSIRQGIIQGEKLDQIAARLAEGLASKNKRKMLMFARTAMTGAQNAGRQQRLDEAQRMGIKVHKEWMCTLDERTRWQHRDLDGQKQPLDKPFRVDAYTIRFPGDPQAHPSMTYNCRCTMVGDLDDYPSEYERRDNIEGKLIKNMTYREWEAAKKGEVVVEEFQTSIAKAKTAEEVAKLMNARKWFRRLAKDMWSEADLSGCDVQSARSIAAAYDRMFERYPQLIGRLDAPNSHPVGMDDNVYAWCYLRAHGQVEVNPKHYSNWSKLERSYEECVATRFHPKGTTAESIIIHELGHAVDGELARAGVLGGYTASGEFRYASSTLKTTVMKKAAKRDPELADDMDFDKRHRGASLAVTRHVSRYATKDNQEWFAECFAEYLTSANPRTVATVFGEELEKLMAKLPPV